MELSRWVKKYGIDQLKFARQKIKYAYFAIAANLFHPDLSDARASYAQNSVLATVADDFFDFGGDKSIIVSAHEESLIGTLFCKVT